MNNVPRIDFSFDYAELYDKLLTAGQSGFKTLKALYTGETFYCFAWQSHGSRLYLHPAASTEESLTRVAQKYQASFLATYGTLSLEEVRICLRYSIADACVKIPNEVFALFDEVCKLTETRSNTLFEIWSRLSNEVGRDLASQALEQHDSQFLETCFAVFRQLNGESVFGGSAERERAVLNFITGDDTYENLLDCAREINPPSVVESYRNGLYAAHAIDLQLFELKKQQSPLNSSKHD